MKEVRTRFAPSPTGFLHVGGIRTALFAYLVAKQAGGQFILRVEDTDRAREVEGSKAHLIASLKALALDCDEGPDIGGSYGPYTQSERLDIYLKFAKQLIDKGLAYADPYTPQEIQAFRDSSKQNKRAFVYRDYRPNNPPIWDGSQPLRLKTTPKSFTYHDEVMGDITTSPEVVDDFILIKSDGYPTYNFAHIIDDAEMNISHVIRGQEFISSMPNFLTLYEALELERPIFAHLPHVLNATGNKKLSKRDGAKDVLEYIADGYLPETLNSFIATLGWNDGSEQEVWTMAELVEKFSLSRVQKSGARFDEKRLLWMNGHFIRQLSADKLNSFAEPFWSRNSLNHTPEYRQQVLSLAQDRLKTLKDLPALTDFFFEEPKPNLELISSNKQLNQLSLEQIRQILEISISELSAISDWTAINIQGSLNTLLEKTQQKPAILFGLIRIVTTWAPFSPQLPDTLELLGRNTTLKRLTSL